MRRVRQVRVLIYEGPEDWVEASVSSDRRYVKGRIVVAQKVKEPAAFGDPMPVSAVYVEDKIIEEHIAPAEEIFHG